MMPAAPDAVAASFTPAREYGIKEAQQAEGARPNLGSSPVNQACASGPRLDANKAGWLRCRISNEAACRGTGGGPPRLSGRERRERALKQYIGIDIAKHEHVAGSRYENGEAHGKAFAFANDEGGFESLLGRLRELGAEPGSCLVVMESTGHYWMALWEFLYLRGFDIAVVNPLLTDAFRKADTLRKTKTDRVDAFLIAEYARFKNLGPSRVSPEDAEGLKQLTRYRHHLVKERAALKNLLGSVADRAFPELAGLFSDGDCATARAILAEFGSAERVAHTDIRTLTNMSRGFKRAIVDIRCPYEENQERLVAIITEEMEKAGQEIEGLTVAPDVMSILSFDTDAVLVRVAAQCPVGEHWRIERDIRTRIKARFDKEGIVMPHYVKPTGI